MAALRPLALAFLMALCIIPQLQGKLMYKLMRWTPLKYRKRLKFKSSCTRSNQVEKRSNKGNMKRPNSFYINHLCSYKQLLQNFTNRHRFPLIIRERRMSVICCAVAISCTNTPISKNVVGENNEFQCIAERRLHD